MVCIIISIRSIIEVMNLPDTVRCAPGYTNCPVIGRKTNGILSTANGLTNIATGHSKSKIEKKNINEYVFWFLKFLY